MNAPLDGPIQPGGDAGRSKRETEAIRKLLANNANFREVMKDGLARFPMHNAFMADLMVQLDGIDACLNRGELKKAIDLLQSFNLDMNARTQEVITGISGRMVEFIDKLEVRAEEKKWEMPQEARDDLDEMLTPYREQIREQMLGTMPIEQRRELEEKARRLREKGDG